MAIEFAERIRRIPVYPAADGYALAEDVALLASNESPYRAAARGARGGRGGAGRRSTATRTRPTRALRDALARPLRRPASGSRSATARCDILLAAGEALLEPGAEVVYAWPTFCVYPHLAAASGARAIEVPLDAEHRHDLDAMRGEITAATRLVIVCNPNNPTSTALPLERDHRLRGRRPAPRRVILDEAYCEFNLLDDPDASIDLLDRHPNLVLLRTFSQGLRPVRPARRLRAVRLGGFPHRRRPGAPAVLLQRRRAGRGGRGARATRTRSPRRVERNLAERLGLEDGLRALGHRARRRRRPTSSGSTCRRRRRARRARAASSRASPSAACSCAPAARSGAPGALRVTVGTAAENERFLDALGALL